MQSKAELGDERSKAQASPGAAQASAQGAAPRVPKRASVRGRYGEISYIRGDDPIGRAISLYGEWAQIEIDFLCGLIGRGSAVLDIGANIGTHALAFSRRVGPMGTVRAFEPQAAVFDLLTCNLAGSGADNVTPALLAVADGAGELAIPAIDYDGHSNIGSVTFLPSRRSEAAVAGAVRAIAIDDLALKRCDLVKIDVEGMEALVLKGMAGTIARLQPLIYCECNTVEAGVDLMRLLPHAYQAFLVRCPAFNEKNALHVAENVFGHACETSLLFAPAAAVRELRGEPSRGAELIPIGSIEDLAKALLATPRYGDASPIERDSVRLAGKLATLADALAERNAKLLSLTQAQMRGALQINELRGSLREADEERQTLGGRLDELRRDLDAERDEALRLRFRIESLSLCLRRAEERSDQACRERDVAMRDAAAMREEFEAVAGGTAGGGGGLKELLAQNIAQVANLATACQRLAARSGGAADDTLLLPSHLPSRRRRGGHPPSGRRHRWRQVGVLFKLFDKARGDYKLVAASGLFDRGWYLQQHRDVAGNGLDPVAHYLSHGASEHRDPSPLFSTRCYLADNPDVVRAGINPLIHYLRYGRREGRRAEPSTSAKEVTP